MTYATLFGILMLVLSPLAIPVFVTACHMMTNWRRNLSPAI
jgi:hypothetical protein